MQRRASPLRERRSRLKTFCENDMWDARILNDKYTYYKPLRAENKERSKYARRSPYIAEGR